MPHGTGGMQRLFFLSSTTQPRDERIVQGILKTQIYCGCTAIEIEICPGTNLTLKTNEWTHVNAEIHELVEVTIIVGQDCVVKDVSKLNDGKMISELPHKTSANI
ncbi:MAG: hypothetical protein NPIRA04_12710 [Nitrospirales bacterium]|nr:MAG: hypothetical protein NPIRA04_12710 [Nitrospirales bacterium]